MKLHFFCMHQFMQRCMQMERKGLSNSYADRVAFKVPGDVYWLPIVALAGYCEIYGLCYIGTSSKQSCKKSWGSGSIPSCHHTSDQGRCKQFFYIVKHAPRASAEMLHLFVKTCRPNELLDSMLEIIEGIDPGAISETILALLPHLQSGNTTNHATVLPTQKSSTCRHKLQQHFFLIFIWLFRGNSEIECKSTQQSRP